VQPPVDIAKLPVPAQRILDGGAPMPLRQLAAKGIAPGLRPVDALTVLTLLAESDQPELAQQAQATLDDIPGPLLTGALSGVLPAGVLDVIAPRYAGSAAVMEKIIRQAEITADTIANVATLASEAVSELIAVNEELLIRNPAIIERLYMNKATRMSTADRLIELAVRHGIELGGIPAFHEAAQAIQGELLAEPTPEPAPEDVLFKELEETAEQIKLDIDNLEDVAVLDKETGEEVVEEKFLPLHAKLVSMSISQKIRRAMLGTSSERMLLVRDKNKLVSSAAIRSPKTQDNEVVMISNSRNVSDEVLRIIATNRDWTKSYQVKLNLVMNPRTPFAFQARMLPYLRESDMKTVAKSKNVSAAVASLARQALERKKGKNG
jgi:hypothetical protein